MTAAISAERGPRGEEDASEVGLDRGPVAVRVRLVDDARNRYARVADQHVQAPEPLGHSVNGRGDSPDASARDRHDDHVAGIMLFHESLLLRTRQP
jgi:hypothetical protein